MKRRQEGEGSTSTSSAGRYLEHYKSLIILDGETKLQRIIRTNKKNVNNIQYNLN